jgi:hypothetical protein
MLGKRTGTFYTAQKRGNMTTDFKPLVCNFLLSHSLDELAEKHGVYARWDSARTKFSLNYDQVEANDSDPLAMECRGLILRPSVLNDADGGFVGGPTKVLARPMSRFFNYGQEAAQAIDFGNPNCRVLEKLDGTLCIVYYDSLKNEWCVATRSVPEADLPVDGFGEWTFRSLFIKAFEETSGMPWTRACEIFSIVPKFTFCFELMTPYNQVVVRHEKCKVALIAIRSNVSGEEFSYDTLCDIWSGKEMLNVPTAQQWKLQTIEDIRSFVNSRSGLDHEGVVVVEYVRTSPTGLNQARRIKIKSPAYLLASRTKTVIGASPRNLMELILQEQIDDLMPLLTEAQCKAVEKMRANLRTYMHNFDKSFHEKMEELKALGPMSDHNRRKSFASMINQSEMWMAPAMSMYEGKARSLHEWILQRKEGAEQRFPSTFLDTLCRVIG